MLLRPHRIAPDLQDGDVIEGMSATHLAGSGNDTGGGPVQQQSDRTMPIARDSVWAGVAWQSTRGRPKGRLTLLG